MFEKILYPTDFSDVAEKALNYVKKLKDSGAREVIVLHVNADYAIAPEGDTSAVKKSDHDPVIVIITPE